MSRDTGQILAEISSFRDAHTSLKADIARLKAERDHEVAGMKSSIGALQSAVADINLRKAISVAKATTFLTVSGAIGGAAWSIIQPVMQLWLKKEFGG